MSSLELAGIDWLGRGWLLTLAFTAAVLLVAVLRRPCRRWFGTERAFQLWLLPPLAMLASQLPHLPGASHTALSSMVYLAFSVTEALPVRAAGSMGVEWRSVAVSIWCAGAVVSMLLAVVAQWRYRRRLAGAVPLPGTSSRWPVLRAATADMGPAMIGAWRPRIVLPADFEHRYDATERGLILAHELAHAQRRDGWWCLLAQGVATAFWFHPLAWWALRALRHDQELACDAAVLRGRAACRRSYANAMLKTQSSRFALPVGCAWSPRHPLTERIAMLKQSASHSFRRRVAGAAAGLALAFVVGGCAYAAGAPSGQTAAVAHVGEYQLDMRVELSRLGDPVSHAERMDIGLCMRPGKTGTVSTHGWQVEATPTPVGDKQLRVDLTVMGEDGNAVARTQVSGGFGEALHAAGNGLDGKQRYAIELTPRAGCPARTVAAESAARSYQVSEKVKNTPARAVAITVAARAGLTLVNPEMLDERLITLDFDHIPAERAMQLIADIDGRKATVEGSRVRFELK